MKLAGVEIMQLEPHRDSRGAFTEVFRASWAPELEPRQWNFVSSRANVMRGLHVHVTHADYLTCVSGAMVVGLKDIRPESATCGQSEVLRLACDAPCAIAIPPGVAHGFYFPAPAMHLYAVSHYWNAADELGCRWDDPEIGIAWGARDPVLSERDRSAGSFQDMVRAFRANWPASAP